MVYYIMKEDDNLCNSIYENLPREYKSFLKDKKIWGYNILGKTTKFLGFNYIDNNINKETDDIIDSIYYQCIKINR